MSPRAWLLLPALVALLAHGRALGSGFTGYDDTEMLLRHDALDDLSRVASLLFRDFWAHTEPVGMWRPLVLLSFAGERACFGDAPLGYHATNLALHAATAVAVAAFAGRLGLAPRLAALAGAVFAAHPVHAETVGWIVGRCDGLATLGTVVALTAHLAGRPIVAAAALAVGLGGKESAAAAIPMAALLALAGHHPAGADRRAAWRRAGLCATVVAVGYTGLRVLALGGLTLPRGGGVVLRDLDLFDRLLVFAYAGARMAGGLLTGAGLCADHTAHAAYLPPFDAWSAGHLLAALGLVACAMGAGFGLSRRRTASTPPPALSLAVALALAGFLPVAQLVPIGAVQADRFCSLPVVGVALGVAWGLARLAIGAAAPISPLAARRLATGLAIAIVAAFGARAIQRHGAFASAEAHAHDVLARYPNDARAWNRLGMAAEERRDPTAAIAAYVEALTLTDHAEARRATRAPLARMNLGTLWLEQGKLEEARLCLELAAREMPRNARLRYNLGKLHTALGQSGTAAGFYGDAIVLAPRWVSPRRNLGALQVRQGLHREATQTYTEALRLAPDDAGLHRELGFAWLALDRPADAAPHFERACDDTRGSARAWLGLGQARAALQQWDGAREAFARTAGLDPRGEWGDAAREAAGALPPRVSPTK